MVNVKVKPLTMENIDDEIVCCLGKQLFKNPPPEFAEGIKYKRDWLKRQIAAYGEAGKIAYKNGEPVGFVEFVAGTVAPMTTLEKENFVFIDCYYVYQREQSKGIGSTLIKSTIQEFSENHPWFNEKPAQSIKLVAFEKLDWKKADPFYAMGFKTEIRWLYPGMEQKQIPVLLTYDIAPKERQTKTITVTLPSQEKLPVLVKVFKSVPCPYGSPDFPEIKQVVSKFGQKVRLEILDMWKQSDLVKTYGPTPGTVVNDKWILASPQDYQSVLENTIKEELKKFL